MIPHPMFTPTEEQEQAIACFETGQNLRIDAYAGTGKTATLELIAQSTRKRRQYLAFNRAVKEEAKQKFPAHVRCTTNHGLAFNAIRARYGFDAAKMTEDANANLIAEALHIPRHVRFSENFALEARAYGALLRYACRRFLYSEDTRPTWKHFPRYGSSRNLPTLSLVNSCETLHRCSNDSGTTCKIRVARQWIDLRLTSRFCSCHVHRSR